MRDPYAVLGVPHSASADDIKKAYRRLAKKLHPDLNPGNRAVEQQFKEATAAYDLLGDPVKRKRYDRGEINADGNEHGFGFGGGGPGGGAGAGRDWRHMAGGSDSFSIDEMVAEFLGRGRGGAGRARPHGAAGQAKAQAEAAQTLRLSFLEAARGGKRRVSLAGGRSIDVTIPAGIESGQKLRLRHPGGSQGDVLLEIEVEPHAVFTRKERDIHVEVPVSLPEAVLGATITVPTIHGAVSLKVPPGSNSGALMRLRGKGIGGDGAAGDQYVKLRVMLPDPPDPELQSFLERWAKSHAYDVRGRLDAAGS
jgi:DnaJ-class molecular chaperone